MISNCNHCGLRTGEADPLALGCTFVLAELAAVVACALMALWSLWTLLLAPAALYLGHWAAWRAPSWWERLRNSFRRCRVCGRCDWAPPDNGFFDRILEVRRDTWTLLAGLDDVDWKSVLHAYGPAVEAPEKIRALAVPDETARREALSWAENALYHNGAIFEATACAVPFLIALLKMPIVECKPEIIRLLRRFVRGGSYHENHAHLELVFPQSRTEEWKAESRKELGWAEAVRREAEAGAAVYLEMLSHPTISVRSAAATALLELCKDSPREAERAAFARLKTERSAVVRADLWMALHGIWSRTRAESIAARDPRRLLLDRFRDSQEAPPVRFVAALSAPAWDADDALEEISTVLRRTFDHCGPYFHASAWFCDYEPTAAVCDALGARLSLQVRWLVERLAHGNARRRVEAVEAARRLCGRRRSAPLVMAPLLVARLADDDPEVRKAAGRTVPYLGRARHLVADEVQCLARHASPHVREAAADALLKLRKPRRRAEPKPAEEEPGTAEDLASLVAVLGTAPDGTDPRRRWRLHAALKEVARRGRSAAGAAPALSAMALGESAWERQHAAYTLWKVGGAVEEVVPVLLTEVESWRLDASHLEMLGEMGAFATSALPALRAIVESDFRRGKAESFEEQIDEDEMLLDAAQDAIRRIEAAAASKTSPMRTAPAPTFHEASLDHGGFNLVRMLDGLDQIDWNAVRHAGGPATDAPEMIRALASPDEAERKRALEWAEYSLCHHGWIVNEATLRATPFLVELLRSPKVVCKPQILRLLRRFAGGNSFHYAHRDCDDLFPLCRTEAWQVEMRKELDWVEGVRRDAGAGTPVYFELLAHEEAAVRSAATATLARAAAASELPRVEAAARARLEVETSPLVRADLVALLQHCWLKRGVAPPDGVHPRTFFLERFRSPAEPPAVRFVAAVLAIPCDGVEMEDEVYDVFLETIDDCGAFFEESAWFHEWDASTLVLRSLWNRLDLQVRWLEKRAQHLDPQKREEALWEAQKLCGERRSAVEPLAPLFLAGLADDVEDVRYVCRWTIPYLGRLRHSIAPAVEALAASHASAEVRASADAALNDLRKLRRAHRRASGSSWESSWEWTFTDVPALVAVLEAKGNSGDPADRRRCDEAVTHLASVGRAAIASAPALKARTKSPSKWERIRAARALWIVGGAAEDVVPVLCAEIGDDDSCLCVLTVLADLGPAATSALPHLRAFLESDIRIPAVGDFKNVIDEDEALCEAAADAIRCIEADAAPDSTAP